MNAAIVCEVCGDDLVDANAIGPGAEGLEGAMVHAGPEPADGHAPVKYVTFHHGCFPGGQWRLDCRDYSGGAWASNALRFGTREDALSYGSDLGARWTSLKMYRAVEITTPDREPYVEGSEDRSYS